MFDRIALNVFADELARTAFMWYETPKGGVDLYIETWNNEWKKNDEISPGGKKTMEEKRKKVPDKFIEYVCSLFGYDAENLSQKQSQSIARFFSNERTVPIFNPQNKSEILILHLPTINERGEEEGEMVLKDITPEDTAKFKSIASKYKI